MQILTLLTHFMAGLPAASQVDMQARDLQSSMCPVPCDLSLPVPAGASACTHEPFSSRCLNSAHTCRHQGLILLTSMDILQGLPGSADSRQLLTTFSHLAKRADWPLCWTELPTAEESILPPTGTWANLGLKSPPLFSTFLHHLQKVSKHDSAGLKQCIGTKIAHCFSRGCERC